MQEVGFALHFNISLSGQLVEPSQPDVAPRSDVVIPNGEFDWHCDDIAHCEPFIDGLGDVATCGQTVFNFTAPEKFAPSIFERLKFVRYKFAPLKSAFVKSESVALVRNRAAR